VSGRPKGDPAADLRAAVTEAHGVLKDLHQALREARALYAELTAGHVTELNETLRKAAEAGNEHLMNAGHEILGYLQHETDKISGHLAEILGAADIPELTNVIVTEAARSLADQLTLTVDANRQARLERK
jgi:4-hydroxy-3-methylbut-2-enyl diphosphate reductase IspH